MQNIKQTLLDFNKAVSDKQPEKAAGIFDNNANVILAGSDKEELHRGNDAIRQFLARFLSNPFSVSWDLANMTIDQHNETAWVFVDGSVTISHDDGKKETLPYRIVAIMVKKAGDWKWRLFNGSVPQG